jgi:hypothetical protein
MNIENKNISISKHPLLRKCYEVNLAIEQSGASKQLTKASTLGNELFKEINDYITLINELNEKYEKEEYRVFKDGDMWCATCPGFINIQESPVGFGETPLIAFNNIFPQEDDETII